MKKSAEDLCHDLRKGFFLSSMMGITDGAACAERSKGCAMVQLGAYLAEPTATAEEQGRHARSFLPADPKMWTDFLAKECAKAGASGVATCLNLAALELEWGLKAAQSFWQAGGLLLELNVHGGYQRYFDQGKLRAMVLPENQGELFRWVEALVALEIPLICKFNGQSDRRHLLPVLDEMARQRVFGVHVNVRNASTKRPDLDLTRSVRERYPGFLLASGYVRSAGDARALFEAGVDMVGIAAPAIEDTTYIHRIATAFRDDAAS